MGKFDLQEYPEEVPRIFYVVLIIASVVLTSQMTRLDLMFFPELGLDRLPVQVQLDIQWPAVTDILLLQAFLARLESLVYQ